MKGFDVWDRGGYDMHGLPTSRKVMEKLESDQTLSEYVQNFSIGQEKVSRNKFPYITVSDVRERIEPLCIGRGAKSMHHYDITIKAGTRHMILKVAHAGDDSGRKGILQLRDDIVTAVFPRNFDGMFELPVRLIKASVEDESASGGMTWTATIKLSGFRSA